MARTFPGPDNANLSGRTGAGRTFWGWAFGGVLTGLLAGLLAFAPARWLASLIGQASGGQVLLEQTRGTIWQGSARLTLHGGQASLDAASLPGRLNWQLGPSFQGGSTGLNLQVSADCCMPQAWIWHVVPRWGGLRMVASDNRSQWPAHVLAGLGTPWNTIQVFGWLTLSTQSLALDWSAGRMRMEGAAQVDALDLSSRLTTLRPMGSYRIALVGGAAPELSLSTLQGSLQLSGRGQWVGDRLRFVGEASAASGTQAALANLLNIIGRREGERSIIKVG